MLNTIHFTQEFARHFDVILNLDAFKIMFFLGLWVPERRCDYHGKHSLCPGHDSFPEASDLHRNEAE